MKKRQFIFIFFIRILLFYYLTGLFVNLPTPQSTNPHPPSSSLSFLFFFLPLNPFPIQLISKKKSKNKNKAKRLFKKTAAAATAANIRMNEKKATIE